MGARANLGWVLDAKRALAGATRSLVGLGILRPELKPARFSLFRINGVILDWPSVLQYLSRLLHRGVSTASADTTDSIYCPPAADHRRLFRSVPSFGRCV